MHQYIVCDTILFKEIRKWLAKVSFKTSRTVGKHEPCNGDEYVLSVVEADNKNALVWLSEAQLIKLKGHIEELIQHKLPTTKE